MNKIKFKKPSKDQVFTVIGALAAGAVAVAQTMADNKKNAEFEAMKEALDKLQQNK